MAAFHSFVGLAAVFTSVASYLTDYNMLTTGMIIARLLIFYCWKKIFMQVLFAGLAAAFIQKSAIYLGALIGGVTFTGSIVAFGKLQVNYSIRIKLHIPLYHMMTKLTRKRLLMT